MILNETSSKCNGKLGDNYILSLVSGFSNDFDRNSLNFTITIERLVDIYDTHIPVLYKSTFVLYINDVPYKKIPFDFVIQGNSKYQVFNVANIPIYNETDANLNIKLDMLIYDESKFIEDTSIETLIFIPSIQESPIRLNLSATEMTNIIKYSISKSISFDLLEYKLNDSPWIKLSSNTFTLDKMNKVMYVQVRGKKNNKYTYSNVIKL